MFKNIFVICFLFLGVHSFSQDIDNMKSVARLSSDSELISYINKAKSNGLSINEVEGLLNANGASSSELQKLRTLWNSGGANSSKSVDVLPDSPGSSFGNSGNNKFTLKANRRFGSDFFNNKNISETPQLFMATPSDYILGPGDDLIINLFGASEITYSVQISRNGTIKIDRANPVYLSGLSINSAKKKLIKSLSKLYTGLLLSDEINKVELDLSLSKARSIVINITGQVTAPGTYTISGFSSVLHALFAAGGPNEIGTYRNIKLLRNGKVYKTIDLYDYFVTGIYPSFYMRDQDVILVEAYNTQIDLSSGFKINGLFELKENESFEDLLRFSGGTSANSFKAKMFVERYDNFSKKMIEIEKKAFLNNSFVDGDIISFKTIKNKNIKDVVKISGGVKIEGSFQLANNKTVGDLINSAKGYSYDSVGINAILFRNNRGLNNELISINLSESHGDLSFELKDRDSLYIPSAKDIAFESKIAIKGEVNSPREIDFRFGLTITDLIIMSGGLTPYANKNDIKIFRNISSEGKNEITKEINVELDDYLIPTKKIILQPDDIVTVNTFPYRKKNSFYLLQGEVALPGLYSIKNQSFTVYDALKENVEFLSSSSLDGVSIIRDSIRIPVNANRLLSSGHKSKFNFELVSGDIINVPEKNKTVIVSGAVQQEGILNVEKPISAKLAINNVGGFNDNANRKDVYVEYQNGLRNVTKNFLFFRFYPKVFPGTKVIVPEKKENKNKTNVGEIVGYTTSLVSIIALLKSL